MVKQFAGWLTELPLVVTFRVCFFSEKLNLGLIKVAFIHSMAPGNCARIRVQEQVPNFFGFGFHVFEHDCQVGHPISNHCNFSVIRNNDNFACTVWVVSNRQIMFHCDVSICGAADELRRAKPICACPTVQDVPVLFGAAFLLF